MTPACGSDQTGGGDDTFSGTGTGGPGSSGPCEPDPAPDGVWAEYVDYQAGETDADPWVAPMPKVGGGHITHPPTPVHIAHLFTGHIFAMHGWSDQWLFRANPLDFRALTWHPIPNEVPLPLYTLEGCPESYTEGWSQPDGYPNLFCAGHIQLPSGDLLIAGGTPPNSQGNPCFGGLDLMYRFRPSYNADLLQQIASAPIRYGWEQLPSMAVDRWYPTLVLLPNGMVLIAGGVSRAVEAQAINTFELFDPTAGPQGAFITGAIDPFEFGGPLGTERLPLYPFLSVLPDGNVFYAGAEDAQNLNESQGRLLEIDYFTNMDGVWSEQVFNSTIPGGSAVQYSPGRILI